jgi:hypothetical protein
VNLKEYVVNVWYLDGDQEQIAFPIENNKLPSLQQIVYKTRGWKHIEKITSSGGKVIFSIHDEADKN